MKTFLSAVPFVCVYANDVDAYIPEFWANESLAILEENMVMAQLVHRDFEPVVQSYGDVVNTRRPGEFKAYRKLPSDNVTIQDATATNVQVPLNQQLHVSFMIRDGEESKSFKDLVTEYMAPAAAQMSTTSENLMKGVKTALESSLVSIFDTVQPIVAQIALALRSAFASDNFKSTVASLAQTVFGFTKFLIDHASAIATVVGWYASYRAGMLAIFALTTGWAAMTAVIGTVTTAVTGLMAGLRAGSLAIALVAAGFTTVAAPVAIVVGLIAAIGAGMYFFGTKTVDATKALREKAAALLSLISLIRRGKSLSISSM
jgi:hypothetical protein